MRRRPLLPAMALVLSVGLGACAGGGTSTDANRAATRGSQSSRSPAGEVSSSAVEKKAGRAASFVEPNGDNSIPTFGAEASASQREEAEAALRDYLSARAAGRWQTACDGLTTSPRKQLRGLVGTSEGCARAYQALSSSAPASTRANPLSHRLVSLRVKGKAAFALFVGPGKQPYVMPMALEGGKWKVTQMAPVAYPLGSETSSAP